MSLPEFNPPEITPEVLEMLNSLSARDWCDAILSDELLPLDDCSDKRIRYSAGWTSEDALTRCDLIKDDVYGTDGSYYLRYRLKVSDNVTHEATRYVLDSRANRAFACDSSWIVTLGADSDTAHETMLHHLRTAPISYDEISTYAASLEAFNDIIKHGIPRRQRVSSALGRALGRTFTPWRYARRKSAWEI